MHNNNDAVEILTIDYDKKQKFAQKITFYTGLQGGITLYFGQYMKLDFTADSLSLLATVIYTIGVVIAILCYTFFLFERRYLMYNFFSYKMNLKHRYIEEGYYNSVEEIDAEYEQETPKFVLMMDCLEVCCFQDIFRITTIGLYIASLFMGISVIADLLRGQIELMFALHMAAIYICFTILRHLFAKELKEEIYVVGKGGGSN